MARTELTRVAIAVAPTLVVGLLLAQDRNQQVSSGTGRQVVIEESTRKATVYVYKTEPYDGGPFAELPARPASDESGLTAAAFRARAWTECEKVRVVIDVVELSDATTNRDRQIATFLLDPGQAVLVGATRSYGAAPVRVSVIDR